MATRAEAVTAAKKNAGWFTTDKQSYIKEVSLVRLSGSNDQMLLRWKCYKKKDAKTGKVTALSHIDHFNVDWEYYDTRNNRWVQGGSGVKQVATGSKAGGFYQDTFSLPSANTVNKVRARVHAIAKDKTAKITYTTTSSKQTSSSSNGKSKTTSTSTTSAKTETVTFKYWKVAWSSYKVFDFNGKVRPATPDAPGVEALKATLPGGEDSLRGVKVSWGGFSRPTTCIVVYRLVDADFPSAAKKLAPIGSHLPREVFQNPEGASYADTDVSAGHVYRYVLRAHNYDGDKETDTGDDYRYSLPFDEMTDSQFELCLSDPVESEPLEVDGLTASMRSLEGDKASVLLEWTDRGYAGDSYRVTYAKSEIGLITPGEHEEFAPDLRFMGEGATMWCVVAGLDPAETYYFHVDVVNGFDRKYSGPVASCVTGSAPEPPTLYATDPSYVSGDEATLAWEHNAPDGSAQESAEVQVTYSGSKNGTETISAGADNAAVLSLDGVPDGTTVTWKARTKGVHPDWSGWSESLSFTVYGKPSCYIQAYQLRDGGARVYDGGTLSALPLVCALTPGGAASQSPVEWSLEVVASGDYVYLGDEGEYYRLRDGSVVARAMATANDPGFSASRQVVEVSAASGVFVNGASYNVRASVLMDSGLRSDDALLPFECGFDYDLPDPTADAFFNGSDYTMLVWPGCYEEDTDDETGEVVSSELVEGVTLSVYRIGSDGEPVVIAEGLPNDGTVVVDAHPSFGTCAYRVVATDPATDQHTVFDTQDVPVPVYGILVQWNEDRMTSYDPGTGEVAYMDSHVFLPYDIAVEETADPDRELVEVIGRKSPIAFSGTQRRVGGTWSANLSKRGDAAVIADLRMLQSHMGTCYVRETSGAGYRAVANVKFGRSYDSDKVPVTLELTRVEYSEVG